MTSRSIEQLERYGEDIACIESGERFTYRQLLAAADGVAAPIDGRPLVALSAANTVPSLAAYLGFLRRGIPVMLLPSDMRQDVLQETLAAYRPGYLFAPLGAWEREAPRSLCSFRGHALFDVGELGARGVAGAPGSQGVPDAPVPLHPDLALLLTTSGSTGSRKYVRLSVRNLNANARSIADYLGIGPGDRAITTLPFSYSYGLSIINSHLLEGATLVLNEDPLVNRRFWDTLREQEATTFGGVPYTYSLLKRLRFERMDLPSLRYLTQAGGRLGEELHREFAETCARKGIGFVVMYGQTEATARMSYLAASDASRFIGSVGKAIPGGRFELRGADGETVERPGEEGELVYFGDNVSLGYAEQASDLAKGDENCGRLETGDIARRDEEGNCYIVGRKKRFLKIHGKRTNLDELDALLEREGFSAASTGSDDRLMVYTDMDDPDAIRTFLIRTIGLNKGTFEIRRIEAIPRSDSGKVRYSALEDRR
ncbi:MAG: AMP-binding protein [Coriobacteriales bacterium]|jgi:acyl-CoA synthetase (AMP-forming)/AMP-acid ligase II|nr:AMP-binding protein [Coriobacteriales bacterium]